MLRTFQVFWFKSIEDLTIELGRVNVFIGENGAGKSNLLEGFAFAGAIMADRVSHEFFASRGIRSPDPAMMSSRFSKKTAKEHDAFVWFHVWDEDSGRHSLAAASHLDLPGDWLTLASPNEQDRKARLPRRKKLDTVAGNPPRNVADILLRSSREGHADKKQAAAFLAAAARAKEGTLSRFLVFTPEAAALRTFADEGQVLPLGVRGEGLFKLLVGLEQDKQRWTDINDTLSLFGWFDGMHIARDAGPMERRLVLRDRHLSVASIDQRSTNEAFLFTLFYAALFVSKDTPPLFAIDNIEASLNPSLCRELMKRLVVLAKKYGKQVLLTTHNAALLDGLSLADDEQRLFVVSRDDKGRTKVRRATAPKPVRDRAALPLSEAFVRGYLGGLPKNF